MPSPQRRAPRVEWRRPLRLTEAEAALTSATIKTLARLMDGFGIELAALFDAPATEVRPVASPGPRRRRR